VAGSRLAEAGVEELRLVEQREDTGYAQRRPRRVAPGVAGRGRGDAIDALRGEEPVEALPFANALPEGPGGVVVAVADHPLEQFLVVDGRPGAGLVVLPEERKHDHDLRQARERKRLEAVRLVGLAAVREEDGEAPVGGPPLEVFRHAGDEEVESLHARVTR
jgi:hypothetical protein